MKRIHLVIAVYMASTGLAYAQSQLDWIQTQGGSIPSGSFVAGHEANGEHLYLCTAPYAGGFHPGKVRPGFRGCNIGYGGSEITVTNYEIATGHGLWSGASGGSVPGYAMQTGVESNDRPLYTCRALHKGGFHPGKVRPGFKGCNIGYGGSEIAIRDYDVLTN